jgi:WD40 repeat-containing protein SMU1
MGGGSIHGLRSGKTLKELRGHLSFVNDLFFSVDGMRLHSVGSDGLVKVWDTRTSECVATFRPRTPGEATVALADASTAALHTVLPVPKQPDHLIVGARAATVYVVTTRGAPVRTLTTGRPAGSGDLTACALSSRGTLLLAVSEDAHVFSFDLDDGKLLGSFKVRRRGASTWWPGSLTRARARTHAWR